MKYTSRFLDSDLGCPGFRQPVREQMESIQGTIQRVDYRRRELTVISQGRQWWFFVPVHCDLFFNSSPASLRCFHPLDSVRVIFRRRDSKHLAAVIDSWEPQPAGDRLQTGE
jgi:hypothetical protein